MSVEQVPDTGDAGTFKRDVIAALPNLRAFAVSLIGTPDKADDLVQDTIMKAWAKQTSFTPGTNLTAWLFTILRNEFYSQMRKRGREVQDSEGTYVERLSVHPAQYGSLDMRDFRRALEQLPEDQREALILVGASGFSYDEAAEICGCKVGTIKSRINRGRARLQEILSVEGAEDFGPDPKAGAITSPAFVA